MSDELTEVFGRQEALHPDLVEYQHEIPRLGMCIRHPLVFSIPHCDAMNSFVNLQYLRKKAAVKRARDHGEWSHYLVLHERPYRWEALQEIRRGPNANEFAKLFSWVWTDSENIWQNESIIRNIMSSPRMTKTAMMENDELLAFDNLDDPVQVYRGHQQHNRLGLSWTTNRDTAVWFARRFNTTGYVTHGFVDKANVFAYFLGRNESEVVCLSQYIREGSTQRV